MPDTLIITLVQRPDFGYVMQAMFASHDTQTNIYSIIETARENASGFSALSECEKKIVKLSEQYADKNLMKAYSHEKNESDFLQNTSYKTISTYIRPFIETQHKEILQQIRISKTPIFLREKTSYRDFNANQAIKVLATPSKMIFMFRNAETFTYSVHIQNETLLVDVFGKFFAPLCANPAQVIIGNNLHFFNDVDEKKLRPFIVKKQIEVPKRNLNEYISSFVLQCVKKYDVLAEGMDVFEQKYKPRASLTLEPDFELRPALHLQFCYGNKRFETDAPYKKEVELIKREEGLPLIGWFFRDKEWEKHCIKILEENGLEQKKDYHFSIKSGQSDAGSIVEWMSQNRHLLSKFELKQLFAKKRYYVGKIDLQLTTSIKQDWFDLYCVVHFENFEIPFLQFKNHILNNISEYLLPDGSIAVLPAAWFARFSELFRLGKISGNSILLGNYHFKVKELAEKGFWEDEKIEKKLLQTLVPDTLNATLRPYQITGFQWLSNLRYNGFGGCLADDMGLGKTLQTITLLLSIYAKKKAEFSEEKNRNEQLSLFGETKPNPKQNAGDTKNRENTTPSLIVMPTSLIHNWLSELTKFAPSLTVYAHTGGNRMKEDAFAHTMLNCQIVLTSYGIVRQDIDFLCKQKFQYLILDESQYIKKPFSQIFSCVKRMHARYKISLTGTPIENAVTDLWSQMDFLNDGILGTLKEFQQRFSQADVIAEEHTQQMLLKIISPFILRRTKEDVSPELPPLTEEICYCEMEEAQALLYAEEKNKARNLLLKELTNGNKVMGFATLSSLMRLRLIANHPAIISPDFKGSSGKFEQIIAHIKTLIAEKHKVLIFSSFVKHLQMLATYFDTQHLQYAWLTGNTVNREVEIEKFNSSENAHVFFISIKAGGTGLNLTAADYVFIIDPWWNPAVEMQAVSRAHRIGQNKKVTLYRFIAKDTVEEKIIHMQQQKSELADMIVRPQLTMEDIEKLLD